jgi:EAL domain-containing protein (putative c-di-GMP-specific phosphodiesterase class I)
VAESPGEFMPIVEQTSMARAAAAWVLDTTLKQLTPRRDTGLDLQISVDVSAANLLEPDFAGRVMAGLVHHSLPASCLKPGITKSAVMEEGGRAIAVLGAIANAVIRLASDEFGTGYRSLPYLQRLPAHVVKIDQFFIRVLASDERKRSLVSTMISLSHDLGYRVVAEGVETGEVLEHGEEAACDEAQDYFSVVRWRRMTSWRGAGVAGMRRMSI